MWLELFIGALQARFEQIVITLPDVESYAGFIEKYRTHNQVSLRPYPIVDEVRNRAQALKFFHDVKADCTLVTYWDHMAKPQWWSKMEGVEGEVWAVCFLSPLAADSSLWSRLFSRKARKRHANKKIFIETPPFLTKMFCLDPLLVEYFNAAGRLRCQLLPDPWLGESLNLSKEEARRQLGLPDDKTIYLHLGGHYTRKGLGDAVEVWESGELPPSAYLLRAGVTRDSYLQRLQDLEARGVAGLINRFLTDEELNLYLCAADWILLPYRDHLGSSGLLCGAAAMGRPVICSFAGVLGTTVKENGLGLLFRHKSVPDLKRVVQESMELDPDSFQAGLQAYRNEHSEANFHRCVRAGADA